MTGRSVTVREAEFTPDEVASLVASRRRDAQRRGPHGYTIAEATDPDNQFAFRVKPPKRDFALKALSNAKEGYEQRYPAAKGDASLVWDVRLEQEPG